MTRTFEARLTSADRQWLMDMEKAMRKFDVPEHMVSVEKYCAVLQSNEFITQENYRLRQEYKALEARFARSESRRKLWTWAAWGALPWLAVLAIWRIW